MLTVLALLEENLHRHALHYFYVIAGGILWRKQTDAGCGGSAEALHLPTIIFVVGVYVDGGALPDAHIFELVLLVIGHHPDIFLRHQRHQWLATLHCLTHLNRLAGDYPIYRRAQSAIFQIKSGLLHGGLLVLCFRLRSSSL